MLGDVGDGWHQVTAELGFERSGPERILSTATMLFDVMRSLARQGGADDRTAAEVGDLVGRMISLRQLSVSVARALTDGQDAAARAALVKDLGTRFEQESVDVAADLIDGIDGDPDAAGLRAMLATARVHSPLFTLRGGTNEVLRGVVAKSRETQREGSRVTRSASWSTTWASVPSMPGSGAAACPTSSTATCGARSRRPG